MNNTLTDESFFAAGLMEASLDPAVNIGVDGKIIDANQAMANITGTTHKQLIGSFFTSYFTEIQKAEDLYLNIFANGRLTNCPLTFLHKKGELTNVVFNGSVYKDSQGNVSGAIVIARDVSEQKRDVDLRIANKELAFQNEEKGKRAAELKIANKELAFQNNEKLKRQNELDLANIELVFQNEEKEKRAAELRIANYARSIIEASRDPLFTISPGGKITDMNNASIKITGIPRETLINSNFFDYFTDPQKAREVYQEVFARGFVADYPLTIRDHKLTDVLFNGSVYKDDIGNVLGASGSGT
jgi:PAS domain S-box-containing protein